MNTAQSPAPLAGPLVSPVSPYRLAEITNDP
ncbi:hypothetical protein SUDANB38_05879 [Streptomyces sp. enrichment culture]